MRYRAFPVAPRPSSNTAEQPPGGRLRRSLTLFGAALVVGGLIRLATDDTTVEVASGDLSDGPTRAASSEKEAEPKEPKEAESAPRHQIDPMDVAIIVTMLRSEQR